MRVAIKDSDSSDSSDSDSDSDSSDDDDDDEKDPKIIKNKSTEYLQLLSCLQYVEKILSDYDFVKNESESREILEKLGSFLSKLFGDFEQIYDCQIPHAMIIHDGKTNQTHLISQLYVD